LKIAEAHAYLIRLLRAVFGSPGPDRRAVHGRTGALRPLPARKAEWRRCRDPLTGGSPRPAPSSTLACSSRSRRPDPPESTSPWPRAICDADAARSRSGWSAC